jgi:hypothetical protein
MPNPLSCISPVLNLLSQELKILPATGQAMEDLQRPDQEEIDDILLMKGKEEIHAFAEIPEPTLESLYRPTPPVFRERNHFFRFFIDGCIRTYYLGTAVEGKRSFPIELAQIGAVIIYRLDNGQVKIYKCGDEVFCKNRVLLLIPHGGDGLSDTLWEKLKILKSPDGFFEPVDINESDILSAQDRGKDPRNVAGGKARYKMHQLEIKLISEIYKSSTENAWTILDGGLRIGEKDYFFDKNGNPYPLIGVAKSFSKTPEFHLGSSKKPKRVDITTLLAGLPFAHRTAAFSMENDEIAFWYVRLREQKELDYPLMGVVKVEVWRKDKNPITSDQADLISSALVGERNVTPYGADKRWHCHLYPIYIAEQAIRSRFFSQAVLLGCINWPKRNFI